MLCYCIIDHSMYPSIIQMCLIEKHNDTLQAGAVGRSQILFSWSNKQSIEIGIEQSSWCESKSSYSYLSLITCRSYRPYFTSISNINQNMKEDDLTIVGSSHKFNMPSMSIRSLSSPIRSMYAVMSICLDHRDLSDQNAVLIEWFAWKHQR